MGITTDAPPYSTRYAKPIGERRRATVVSIEEHTMAAYCIFDVIEVHDEQQMGAYREGVVATVEKFGGKYIVIGGPVELIEGPHKPSFPVIIEFPSLAQARSWYTSESYKGLLKLRLAATTSHAYIVAGLGELS